MERLDAAGRHPENQDPTRQFAIKQAKSLLRAAKVKDPCPKVDRRPSATKSEIQKVDPLKVAVETYQNQPHTPELVTQTHKAIWQARGELIGETYEVISCPYSEDKLAELKENGERVGFLPRELATQATRHKLGAMHPKMQSHSVQEGNSVTNDEDHAGWFTYEVAIDAPYLDTTEKKLEEDVKKAGRRLLTLNEYIVAGQDSKLFTGKYLDETRTWARFGSRDDGRIVSARFVGDGSLRVLSILDADRHFPHLGGRSSGVKKA